jgi:hypothetical protein
MISCCVVTVDAITFTRLLFADIFDSFVARIACTFVREKIALI